MQPALALDQNLIPLHATGVLEINTKAIAHNYTVLRSLLQKSNCAAVLKANAYGFGANAVARTLAHEGCEHFFVAHLEEGIKLRHTLKSAYIYVLSGLLSDTADLFVEHALTPILNDFGMVKEWAEEARRRNKKLPCGLHFDTGMHRNGFDKANTAQLFDSIELLESLDVQFVMSHLVSSHDPKDPLNLQQKTLFDTILKQFPEAKSSLADTGGVYLGSDYHYDIARVGKGLFGLFPASPLLPCAKLMGRILQLRTAAKGESVGYGATHTLTRDSKLATIGIGFADGYDRRLQNSHAFIQGHKAPVVGRISMDYTVIDVTDVPACEVGSWAELVNETLTLDVLANSIGTISRELSTGFGNRLHRVYV